MFAAMTRLSALAILLALAAPAAASAQVWEPPRPGQAPVDYNRYQADQNRYEMERLRAQADQREAFARQLESEAAQRRQQIESARQPAPAPASDYRGLRSLEEERAARQAATASRQATADGVGQIDAWLDRPPR